MGGNGHAPSILDRGEFVQDPTQLYLDYVQAGGRTPGTVKNYAGNLRALQRCLGEKPITEATGGDVIAYIQASHSDHQRLDRLITLRQFWKFLVGRGVVAADVTAGVPVPKMHRKQYPPVTEEEFVRLITYLPPRVKVLAAVMYRVGARVEETCQMQPEHVIMNGEEGVIEFPKRKGGDSGFCVFGPDLAHVLIPYLKQRERHTWLFPNYEPGVAAHKYGNRPMNKHQVEHHFKNASLKAGLKVSINPHRLRHTYITRAIEKGWPQLALQQQVGHKNAVSTAWYYRPSRDGLLELNRKLAGRTASRLVTEVDPHAPALPPEWADKVLIHLDRMTKAIQAMHATLSGRLEDIQHHTAALAQKQLLSNRLESVQQLLNRLERLTQEKNP